MAKRTAPTRSVPGRPSRSSSPSAAVAYLRRSTDRQEQSLDDQRAAIERFAQDRGLVALRWYVDDAISGTDASRRRAFREMMADASSPARLFSTVLVYDIKRFGRVDNDEAGHYRWLLRSSGIAVVYVAEGFTGGTIDDLLRPVKQWQAREESRDLSKVTIRGMVSRIRRDAERGFWDARKFVAQAMPINSKYLNGTSEEAWDKARFLRVEQGLEAVSKGCLQASTT